eukprot:2920264-Alexandrium_andersonii.AAC.1
MRPASASCGRSIRLSRGWFCCVASPTTSGTRARLRCRASPGWWTAGRRWATATSAATWLRPTGPATLTGLRAVATSG